jgi:hypothetical protein
MDTRTQGILTLIKSAVTGEKLPLPQDFSLEDAMEQIKRHSLQAMAYQGAFLCGVSSPVMASLLQRYYIGLMRSEAQMAALKSLMDAFEEAGIDYMPVKGVILKPLYPKPELRSMGDADILIRLEQYDRIVPIMEALGYQFKKETDHELVWISDRLNVELHKRLIPSYNLDYAGYYGDGWQLAKQRKGCRFEMGEEDTFVYLFSHYAKHYRDGGIGCRHVADLWLWRRTHPHMDEAYIGQEMKKLGLEAFYGNTLRLLGMWFGDGPADDIVEFMTEYIFASGNFGMLENRVLSRGLKTMKQKQSLRGEWFRQLMVGLFPGLVFMKKQYPVLEKCPWLLPLFWLVRVFDKLLFQRKKPEYLRRSLSVFREENLDAHQKALRYVGLDYRF